MKTINIETGDLLHLNDRLASRSNTYLISIEKTDYGFEKITAVQVDNPNNILEVSFLKPAVTVPSSPSITAINSKEE